MKPRVYTEHQHGQSLYLLLGKCVHVGKYIDGLMRWNDSVQIFQLGPPVRLTQEDGIIFWMAWLGEVWMLIGTRLGEEVLDRIQNRW
jgi:hypothetical protein